MYISYLRDTQPRGQVEAIFFLIKPLQFGVFLSMAMLCPGLEMIHACARKSVLLGSRTSTPLPGLFDLGDPDSFQG